MHYLEAHELATAQLPHPIQLEILDFSTYDLVIDARSPHEYVEDHVPSAINLPVVDDAEYAEVGTKHRHNPHAAYLVGVEYSLRNLARHVGSLVANYPQSARMLVYCFRGGKRSKLWADTLRTIGYEVDVLRGGWKAYRRWVRQSLDSLPGHFEFRVLSGATGCGKTRLLMALAETGQQVLDLEELASHRGSLIGAIPGRTQPTQKLFDSMLLDRLRSMHTDRPIWVEAESKKIGNVALPDSLHAAMHRTTPYELDAPMSERVRLWREDYPHFVQDPEAMVAKLACLKPLIGGEELGLWDKLAAERRTDELFERVMVAHYDPRYARSTKNTYGLEAISLSLDSLSPPNLLRVARELAAKSKGGPPAPA